MAAIGSLLRWDSPNLVLELENRERRHLARMVQQFGSVLSHVQTNIDAINTLAKIRDLVSKLSEESLLRFLSAPETHFRFTSPNRPNNSLLEYVLQSLHAEERREFDLHPGGHVWTALGDIEFSRLGVAYRAPHIGAGCVVDFSSPYSDPPFEDARAPTGAYSVNQTPELLSMLNSALQKISRVNPNAFHLICNSLKVVSLRRHEGKPRNYLSSSCRAFIGKASILNIHLSDVSVASVADTLVHEAIHSFLYEREQITRWVSRDYEARRSIRSPWTNNMLRLDNFLQACFVWYGLSRFWSEKKVKEEFSSEYVDKFRDRALHGFSFDILAIIEKNMGLIHESIPGELLWICTDIEANR